MGLDPVRILKQDLEKGAHQLSDALAGDFGVLCHQMGSALILLFHINIPDKHFYLEHISNTTERHPSVSMY